MSCDELSPSQLALLRGRFLDPKKYFSSLTLKGLDLADLSPCPLPNAIRQPRKLWVFFQGVMHPATAPSHLTTTISYLSNLGHPVACHRNPGNFYKCVWKKNNLSGMPLFLRVKEETYDFSAKSVQGRVVPSVRESLTPSVIKPDSTPVKVV